jgi:hypothetical protein
MSCKGKFWIEEFSELFCKFDPVPLPSMSFSEQLNAVMQLFIIVGILMCVFMAISRNSLWWLGFVFMAFGGLLTVILFYSLRNMQCTENYKDVQRSRSTSIEKAARPCPKKQYSVEFFDPGCTTESVVAKCSENTNNPARIATIYSQVNPGPDFVSVNQKLAGNPAKRTMVAPVSVPPPFSSAWKENSLVVRAGINSATNQDLSQSGYLVSQDTYDCADNIGQEMCIGDKDMNIELLQSSFVPRRDVVENFSVPEEQTTIDDNPTVPLTNTPQGRQTYDFPYHQGQRTNLFDISDSHYSGDVLMSDGYFPNQPIDNNLPSNVNFGKCPKDPVFNEYNKQTYTSIIEPGVYTRNQITEPISSNIGISFTQQFEPVTCKKDRDGITFIGHDPNITPVPFEKPEQLIPYDRQTHLADIYDPRYTGYGTSYRSYVEPVTGQVRFYYDDVDAYKRPNYISRSKVDFIPSSISTQAIPNSQYFKTQNKYSRTIAQQRFANDTMDFRTDMQERLMRKANANLEQARRFPKHQRSFTRGSMCNPRAR